MCLFNDLPNELLCQVAEFLPTGAVHALALTSRKLKRVSYPVLYKKISLPIPIGKPKQGDNRILLFARTLTARPDLADGITGLDVSVQTDHPDMISTDVNIGAMRALGASIIETIPDTLPLGSQRNNKAWLQRLFDVDDLAWLGLLLYMLPSLETLMDFSLVPGLCGLKELGLQCREASGEWCYLPKLERMWLDQKVKFVQHNQSRPSLSVTEMSMALSTNVLWPRVTAQILGHSGFWKPSPFAVLRRLNIDLDNVLRFRGTLKPADIIREGIYTQGAARMLSAQLKPHAHTLEELHLTVANGTDSQFLDHVGPFPVGTLTTFRKLKVLWLPQALLLPRDLIPRPELIQDNEPLTVDDAFFPATLRSLRLLYPTTEVHGWLKYILPSRVVLPELECIETMITTKHGATLLAHRKGPEQWITTTTSGISERTVEYNSANPGRGEIQSPFEAQLLFEIALRDKLIEELQQKLSDKAA